MSKHQLLPARRTIHHADALAWLDSHAAEPGTSVITSLPDVSETGTLTFPAWKDFFVTAARRVLRWLPADGVAIFFQSDIRHEGAWVDKGYLIMRAAEQENAHLVWHKIVCRRPPGSIAQGRASYSHMLCVAPVARPSPRQPGPDVLADAGLMTWPKGMGEKACQVACRFLHEETATRLVVDPFCGQGAALAVANGYGFEAIGVDRSLARCREAKELTL
jgi:hypothetical protein